MAKKRKAGAGTVRLRSDGRWEGRVVIGYDDKGLPKTKNVLAKTKTECLEKLEKLKEQVGAPTDKLRPDMPFGEWIDYWYRTFSKNKLQPQTQSGYEDRIYLHIIPELGKIPLDKLTQNDLQQFYARLKKSGRLIRREAYGEGLSDRMVRGCHMHCRTALDRAVRDGLIRVNPAVGCKLPPKKAKEMQILSREELQRFLIQAQAEGYYEMFLLELATGMRRGELCGLRWEDLNFRTGELHIRRQISKVRGELLEMPPKTKGSSRTVILPSGVVEALREYRKRIDSRWMFPSPVKEDSPREPRAVSKRLRIILERAGCKQVRFHDLRHTFATMALEHGMDVKTLSAVIGHVSAATTLDIYSHVTDKMQLQAAVNIDRGIGHSDAELPTQESASAEADDQSDFVPTHGKHRRPGTGCITMINDHLYEGRYTPTINGKRVSKNVYAHTREECEEKLAKMIEEVKGEIAEAQRLS